MFKKALDISQTFKAAAKDIQVRINYIFDSYSIRLTTVVGKIIL